MDTELETAPSPAQLKGLAEWWDNRLRMSEREALWLLAGLGSADLHTARRVAWRVLSREQRAYLVVAFQRMVQLGIECALALDWQGTKGTGLDAEDEFRTLT